MNFLAHIYLSGESKEVLIGNFIADAVKKSDFELYSPDIIRGIKLHHQIDEYTDKHSIVGESKKRLRPRYGKYAPVIVDIYYDHFLAADWQNYSGIPLSDFAVSIYDLMSQNMAIMPAKVKHFLPYMISGNWIANYAHMEGIHSVLKGMSRRAKFESGMEKAIEDLKTDYEMYKKEFQDFFPDLEKFVNQSGYIR